jgi:hypothetical protein
MRFPQQSNRLWTSFGHGTGDAISPHIRRIEACAWRVVRVRPLGCFQRRRLAVHCVCLPQVSTLSDNAAVEPYAFAPEEPIRLFRRKESVDHLPSRTALRLTRFGMAAIFVLVAGGATAAFAVSDRGSTLLSSLTRSTLPAEIEIVPTAASRPHLVSASLLGQTADFVQTFSGIATPPGEVCSSISDAGFRTEGWHPSLAGGGRSECSFTYSAALTDDGQDDSSLFAVVRGTDSEGVGSIFVKLNLLDPAQDHLVMERASDLLTLVGRYPDLAVPSFVTRAIAERRPVRWVTDTARFSFTAERDDPQRYNLTIRYSPRLAEAALHATAHQTLEPAVR